LGSALKHTGVQIDFGMPVFFLNWKTNTSVPTCFVLTRSCSVRPFPFPNWKVFPKEPIFGQLKSSMRRRLTGLRQSHKITSRNASRPERIVWSIVSFGLILFWRGQYVNTKL
jgi:hypothetical protein